MCSAVDDDVREKQTELGGGNGSTIVEDGPGIGNYQNLYFILKIVLGLLACEPEQS